VEDQELTFDYTVHQKNKDPWNLLLGFNWDVNKQFSWNLEYDGSSARAKRSSPSVNWSFEQRDFAAVARVPLDSRQHLSSVLFLLHLPISVSSACGDTGRPRKPRSSSAVSCVCPELKRFCDSHENSACHLYRMDRAATQSAAEDPQSRLHRDRSSPCSPASHELHAHQPPRELRMRNYIQIAMGDLRPTTFGS